MSRTERFVIDTNMLLSSLFVRDSTTFKALEKARNKGELLFSEATFLEFELVLFRKKFDKYFSKEERLQIIEKIHNEAVFIPVTSNLQISRDSKDDKFLNLATDANASCIITGDKDLLVLHPFGNISILSPGDFLSTF
ncbi:MAG TPA: putative toxin-antitoxin system toxin component, PIN family [Mucilaginibacter sp.]|jgi:putative PIN family toxin of toxin-antitoxin system|nr:putative toxin-antitoxin system toxin component, PIN family [Mucilaginibacter sp.]